MIGQDDVRSAVAADPERDEWERMLTEHLLARRQAVRQERARRRRREQRLTDRFRLARD